MSEPRRQIPTLFDLALSQAPVASPGSRLLLDESLDRGHLDAFTMDIVNELELAHLYCRGRIPMEGVVPHGCSTVDYNMHRKFRDPGVIDDARLQNFYEDTGTVVLRLDSWQNMAFWAECHLPLDQLQQWLRTQGVDMQWRVMPSNDEKNESDTASDSEGHGI